MTEEKRRFLDHADGTGEDETSLRPLSLGEFVGQEKLKEKLSIFIQAARQRGESLDHCLFYGPPRTGKDDPRKHHREGDGGAASGHYRTGSREDG